MTYGKLSDRCLKVFVVLLIAGVLGGFCLPHFVEAVAGGYNTRGSKDFVSPSHLVIVDVDGLHSYQEAVEMRRMLYDDPLLQPVLTFVSPSGLGVKAFVPCHYSSTTDDARNITDNMSWAMRYVETAYNTITAVSSETKSKVDFSGKDLVRSCFLLLKAYSLV